MMYYTLVTSLPRHDREFKVKQTPISRIQLEKRLKLLPENERATLLQLEKLVWKSWFAPECPFVETKNLATTLMARRNTFMNDVILWYLDLRSLFAALRLRAKGLPPPPHPHDHWFGRLNMRLINHWNDPDFGLRVVYPWLSEVNKMLTKNRSAEVEDILLTRIWEHLGVIEGQHYFDFEALIVYMLRWNVINYWSQLNEKLATTRVNELMLKTIDNPIEPNQDQVA